MANIDEVAHLEALQNLEMADISARWPRRRFITRRDPFECMSEDLFIKKFNRLEPFFEAPSRNSALTKELKVLVALNFYASGSYQTSVGQNLYFGISQSSASRYVREVTDALNERPNFNQWVTFPQTIHELRNFRHELRKYDSEHRDFMRKNGKGRNAIAQCEKILLQILSFIRIIGCIDCTYVAIYPPTEKNYHSINVQLICAAKMRSTNVNSEFPGSSHDCHIWNSSRVKDDVRHISDAHPDFFLIGDSGYTLRAWLLTPLQDLPPDTPEFRYNKAFKNARCIIERESIDNGEIIPGFWRHDASSPQLRDFAGIPRRSTAVAQAIRDEFAEYFISPIGKLNFQNNK